MTKIILAHSLSPRIDGLIELPSPIEITHSVNKRCPTTIEHHQSSYPSVPLSYRYSAQFPSTCSTQHPLHEPLVPRPLTIITTPPQSLPPTATTAVAHDQREVVGDGRGGGSLLPELLPIYLPLEVHSDGGRGKLGNNSEYDLVSTYLRTSRKLLKLLLG